jgi:transposase
LSVSALCVVDPQAWLADVLARINDHKITDIAALLPWHSAAEIEHRKVAA